MAKLNPRKLALATVSGSLWLFVLVPILGVSAYSLYFIARHLGVPPLIAASMSTCFDGVTLIAAEYSLRYAQTGMSGTLPNTMVRLFALLAAYLQTLHAKLGNEPLGAWILWSSLPIGAVSVYEVHIRWERRRALARAGVMFPAPLPAFGLVTWVLFPLSTLTSLRLIVEKRRTIILKAAEQRGAIALIDGEKPKLPNAKVPNDKATNAKPATVVSISGQPLTGTARAPKREIRTWAKQQGYKVGDRARIPAWIERKYWETHPSAQTVEPERVEEAT